jgi:hypothetical protein
VYMETLTAASPESTDRGASQFGTLPIKPDLLATAVLGTGDRTDMCPA